VGYRIVYESAFVKKTKICRVTSHKQYIIIGSLLLLMLFGMCWLGWNKTNIQRYLLPGDPDITGAAIEELIEKIRSGTSVSDAVSAFCNEIVDRAALE